MLKTLTALSLVVLLAACGGGGSTADDLTWAKNVTDNATRANAAPYTHGQAFTVEGDAAVTESCLQGSGVGIATLADGTILECPTYTSGVCVAVTQRPVATCNPHLHFPF